eukprot:Blabericola_migrator_1__10765@NODE_617_length_7255_cov_83_500696_g450_i0_p4_GENE_NODE_617_length_7255_cov_83_500696_g450_i0NODE_617_length_7255_cov_83_500696_g450_i0_p4_ORF_typecomplete_len337_score79_24ADH_zinc_N_2/PF13602_6/1_7e21ADH_zinc_N/PF00107_26/2_5e15ADH_zinc_N/PF00107_26/1_8e03ADH_N/PF08240_12/4_3e08ADH_N/PF08240_12/46ADH_N_2/PF16884_5/0_0066DUF2855/PF11017_8/2DUF2855/PF11017_8/2e02_NODE_617_length_7255_cov_83_500696_g450_i031484158
MSSTQKHNRAWLYSDASKGLENGIKLYDNLEMPQLATGDILVKVKAMSLNPVDIKIPETGWATRLIRTVPAAPGLDFAGVVEESRHDAFRAGERVFGWVKINFMKYGSLSEYIVTCHSRCASLPDKMSFEDGAALGGAGVTALQAIKPYVTVGDRVFVNGGSGGTGIFSIQIAKVLGCHVTASCSTPNVDFCRELGADEVLDYKTQDICAELKSKGQVFKLVVDNVGNSPADLYTAANYFLMPDGVFVQVGQAFDMIGLTLSRKLVPGFLGGGKRLFIMMMVTQNREDLIEVCRLVDEGKVKVVIDEAFKFEDAPKAISKVKTHRVKGKVVVVMSD